MFSGSNEVSVSRYYHRSLNPKKLVDIGFSHLGARMTMARWIKLYKLPQDPKKPIRKMVEADIPQVADLLSVRTFRKFQLPIDLNF